MKRGKDEEVNGQGGKRGAPAPHGAHGVGKGREKEGRNGKEGTEEREETPAKFISGYILAFFIF